MEVHILLLLEHKFLALIDNLYQKQISKDIIDALKIVKFCNILN